MSRATLAVALGVKPITVYRWETGTALPSPRAGEKLCGLGFGIPLHHETNAPSFPRLKARARRGMVATHAVELREAARITLQTDRGPIKFLPAPFVRNGPPDQSNFHRKLLALQFSSNGLLQEQLLRRLSMVEEVEDIGPTVQNLLENPRPTAVSWDSNYGTHGWHRYVGRFPAPVVRALLNHFGADRHSLVCDPFAGSGTTAVECRLLGIPFVGIEICPLSCMMIRTKAAFPADAALLHDLAQGFRTSYQERWNSFLKGRRMSEITHSDVLHRKANPVPRFANIERWFTPAALLGVSIGVEIGMSHQGFSREAILLALSSKMRSIGNVDVDVVRAEYSRKPRENVDVGRMVSRQLHQMAADVAACLCSHAGVIGSPSSITLHEGSVLDVNLPECSVGHVITSPPYGVEAISYLRTHLLSYRSLFVHLGHGPYDTRAKTIGSEYVPETSAHAEHRAGHTSPTCRQFFAASNGSWDSKYRARRAAMIQFCDDMLAVGERLSKWLKENGRVAFIIGNKRLGKAVIPMDTIVTELFSGCGLRFVEAIRHKLKTNNSNSQVPWQERIIQEESILLFTKTRGTQ